MILVSACLIGINCKYNGNNNENTVILEYLKDKNFVPICPEQLGGLSTPRVPSEIIDGSGYEVLEGNTLVLNNQEKDVTHNFLRGAKETLKIAKLYNIEEAILKEGSPSCGSSYIYDGSFSGNKINGVGVTTALLKKNNIKVKSESEICQKT